MLWLEYYTRNTFASNMSFLQGKWPDIYLMSTFFCCRSILTSINTLRPRQNGRHFADSIFKCIVLNENVWIPIKISLKFVPKGPSNNIPALVQIMAWRRPGDKPLSEPMVVRSLTHICVTRPQWVNSFSLKLFKSSHPVHRITHNLFHGVIYLQCFP